jgi:hypothetical protein
MNTVSGMGVCKPLSYEFLLQLAKIAGLMLLQGLSL